ncbi:MAG TPA: uracil-DNA glycosylase, partial [Allosphingosinicella sp.]|nr:uracil-DNA glycosylase [Allosphingosinicella sp.]
MMYAVALSAEDDFDGWRVAARALASAGVAVGEISWRVAGGSGDLLGAGSALPEGGSPFPVPRAFLTLAETAICHSDPERFALLYALLLRIHAVPRALEDEADPLVRRVEGMAKAVRRDIHKMHAFV